jgi:hypothetical protein
VSNNLVERLMGMLPGGERSATLVHRGNQRKGGAIRKVQASYAARPA